MTEQMVCLWVLFKFFSVLEVTKAPEGALTQSQQACHRFTGLAALWADLCAVSNA
ncbi:MAG: hypothetical protein GXP14_09465 [Gammaproteobacteria bacterium]|nr:hypothetical protein [Gammaproteobacteria bacterium]